jgi:hypothetical protein
LLKQKTWQTLAQKESGTIKNHIFRCSYNELVFVF